MPADLWPLTVNQCFYEHSLGSTPSFQAAARTHPPNRPTNQPPIHPATQRARHTLFTLPSLSFLHMCVRPMLFEQLPEICTATTSKHRCPLNDRTITTGRHNVLVIMREHRRWNRVHGMITRIFATRYIRRVLLRRNRNYLLTINSITFKLMFVQTCRIIDLARALINNSIYALGHVI